MGLKQAYNLVYEKIIWGIPCRIFDSLYITANILSVLRTALILPIYYYIFVVPEPQFRTAFWIFLAAIIADSGDGVLSRYLEEKYITKGKPIKKLWLKLQQLPYVGWLFHVGVSNNGKLIDATFDKLTIIPLFYFFYLDYQMLTRIMGVALTHLEVISFCLGMMKYYAEKNHPVQIQNSGSSFWGKAKMVTECVAISFILCYTPFNPHTMLAAQILIILALPLALLSVKGHFSAITSSPFQGEVRVR